MTEADEPLSTRDLAMIDQAWENHKAALPVATVINDNQPGRTAIIEITIDPPTLPVGTKLYAGPKVIGLSRPDAGGDGVREELEEDRIDRLRLTAFKSNDASDRQAYFDATSKWFQDRHYRRMAAPLSTPPAAVNASAEARLREALELAVDALRHIRRASSVECPFIDLVLEKTTRALSSAGGDEAKKSEGGVEVRHAQAGNMLGSVPREEMSSSATGIERATVQEAALQPCAGVTPGPSDPTADRREIVRRAINGIYGIGKGTFAGGHQDKSIERAVDTILDGGW